MLSASEREYLRQIPLFASLDEDALTQVGAATVVRQYDRGEVIAVEGERGGSLRYVQSGFVKLATTSAEGHEQILRLVPAGQTFNLVAALDGQPTAATATALDPTTIFAIHRDVVTRVLAEHPAVAQAALRALAADNRDMISLAKDLALYHVSERVARLLLDQERCTCERCRNHYMTQQEMAAIVGTAREMVGRTLHEFQAAGIIELHNGHVVVRDLDRLRAVAREQVNTRSRTRRDPVADLHGQHTPHDQHG
jgi:CRP/FNR family cyclic AMP-dependent transcriptional regulator